MYVSHEETFWLRVQQTSTCWLWLGSRMPSGYGTFRTGKHKRWLAHRFSWENARGLIPKGLSVLHKCDNPPCVRPDHLFLGTHLDNMADMRRKGRSTHGERGTMVKLSEFQVKEIHALYASGKFNQTELATRFSVSGSLVGMIARGKVWAHLGLPPIDGTPRKRLNPPQGERHGQSKLTDAQAQNIRNRYGKGERVNKLAHEFGVSHSLISMIVHNRVRHHP